MFYDIIFNHDLNILNFDQNTIIRFAQLQKQPYLRQIF